MSQATELESSSATPLRPNEFNLIWVDMEMTGLDPDNDRIIEVAVVVTDSNLNILGEGPVFAIHQSDEVLDGMDAWNKLSLIHIPSPRDLSTSRMPSSA